MGILNRKERIIDFQLTDKGRELLSKNSLNFTYYIFSDDFVDYSGSLNERSSAQTTSSGAYFDDFVHNNFFPFEPMKRHDKTINNYLYTMPLQSEVTSQFVSSITGSITLQRNYEIEQLDVIVNAGTDIEKLTSQEDVLDWVVTTEEVPGPSRPQKHVKLQIDNFMSQLDIIKKLLK